MATQFCPNCNEDFFTWYIDDEESRFTVWFCNKCHYRVLEDESLIRKCSSCLSETELRLDDGEKKYWWCCKCSKITTIIEK